MENITALFSFIKSTSETLRIRTFAKGPIVSGTLTKSNGSWMDLRRITLDLLIQTLFLGCLTNLSDGREKQSVRVVRDELILPSLQN